MNIVNYSLFTPIESLVGGIVIGLTSVFMFIMFGRIAGVSGILGSALKFVKNDTLWRFSFLFGIVSSGIIFSRLIDYRLLQSNVDLKSFVTILIAGLFVGFGTRLGSGCTSGHGICGIGRFSKRSIVATCVFLLSGIVTVLLMKIIK